MSDVTAVDSALDHLLGLSVVVSATTIPVRDQRPPTGERLTDYILAGDDGDPDADEVEAGASDIERAAFEEDTRDESGFIQLAVVSQSGRSDMGDLAACRTSSKATLAALAAAIGADPTLGGAVADCWVSSVTTIQGRNEMGAYVRRPVVLAFEALQE